MECRNSFASHSNSCHPMDTVARRVELERALHAVGGVLRSDSELCRQYIAGTGRMSLEDVVKKTREIQFFHSHTDYAHRLRESRFMAGDGRGAETRYWRRREAYRDGIIDDIDDVLFDSDESDDDSESREEARRERAKHQALTNWIKSIPQMMALVDKIDISDRDVRDVIAFSDDASVLPECMITDVIAKLATIKRSQNARSRKKQKV
jgi:hypothetical protein